MPKIAYNSEPGSHQHTGKPNGFPCSALLCQEADFQYGEYTAAQDGAALVNTKRPGIGATFVKTRGFP